MEGLLRDCGGSSRSVSWISQVEYVRGDHFALKCGPVRKSVEFGPVQLDSLVGISRWLCR